MSLVCRCEDPCQTTTGGLWCLTPLNFVKPPKHTLPHGWLIM